MQGGHFLDGLRIALAFGEHQVQQVDLPRQQRIAIGGVAVVPGPELLVGFRVGKVAHPLAVGLGHRVEGLGRAGGGGFPLFQVDRFVTLCDLSDRFFDGGAERIRHSTHLNSAKSQQVASGRCDEPGGTGRGKKGPRS